MKVYGKDVILSIDQIEVACARNCELDVEQDFIQVCSPVSGRWRKYIPSMIGWTASVEMLATTMENPQKWLEAMKQSQRPLTMRYFDIGMKIYQVGEVWISSWQNGASVQGLTTFSVQLQGNGELRKADERDYPFLVRDTLHTLWNFDEEESTFTDTDRELDEVHGILEQHA